jgi:hypothetical protein
MRIPNQTLGVVRRNTSGRYLSGANQSYTVAAQGVSGELLFRQ